MYKNEDALLDLTAEQYEQYLSVLSRSEKETVSIDLPEVTELPSPVKTKNVKTLASALLKEGTKLLPQENTKNHSFSFSEPSGKEKEKYMAIYYTAINGILRVSDELMTLFPVIKAERDRLHEAYVQRVRLYHAYLPYKLALADKNSYQTELDRLEKEITDGLESSLRLVKDADTVLDTVMIVCESIIPELLAKSGAATGAPPYPDFSKRKIFEAIRSFCEQINVQMRRLPV